MTNNYTSVIINNLYNNMHDCDNNCIFIKHYSNLCLDMECITEYLPKKPDCDLFFYNYDSCSIQEAYNPWFSWLYEIYHKHYFDMSPESFIEKCNIYYSHQSIFISYLKTKRCERAEDIILCEVPYERKRFFESYFAIIEYITREHPLYFVLNDIHLGSYSSIEIICKYLLHFRMDRIAILATFNEVYTQPAHLQTIWTHLLNTVEKCNIMLDYTINTPVTLNKPFISFVPDAKEFDNYINIISNQIQSLALEQALQYLDIITNNISNDAYNITEKQRYTIYVMSIYTNLCIGNYSMALHQCENIASLDIITSDKAIRFEYNYLLGLVHIYNTQYSLATNYVKICKKIASDTEDDYFEFKSVLLYYINYFKGWSDLFLIIRVLTFNVDYNFFKKLDKYGYKMHKSYILSIGFENDEYYYRNPKNIFDKMPSFSQGIEIANKLDNYNLIMMAYNKCVIISSSHGYLATVDFFLKKWLDCVDKHPNDHTTADIFNSLGYNQIIAENFSVAHDYFVQAITRFYTLKEAEEYSETLYNMAINAFMANNFEASSEFMQASVNIIHNLSIERLRVCNISKQYGIIALSNYFTGIEYNCYFYLNLMKRVLSHVIDATDEHLFVSWDDDLFLYYLVSGILEKNSGNLDTSQYNFERAHFHLKRSNGILFWGYTLFCIEYSKLYTSLSKPDKAKEILLECIEYSSKKGYSYKVNCLYAELNKTSIPKPNIEFKIPGISLDDLFEQSYNTGLGLEAVEKSKDIAFIVMWQELLNKNSYATEDALINTATSTLHNYFGVDKILLIENVNNTPIIRHSDNNVAFSSSKINSVINYMTNLGRDFVANRTDRSFDEHKDIISLFGQDNTVSLIGLLSHSKDNSTNILITYITMYENFTTQYALLNDRSLLLLKCLFKQLIDTLERTRIIKKVERINLQLKKLADTDQLTRLLNRQGLNKKIEANSELNLLAPKQLIYVLYIDLDNFKYYNDTFGHSIGDQLLISFSDLLKKLISKNDYAVRYGGDEFLVLLLGSTRDNAISLAQTILADLTHDYFFEQIGLTLEDIADAKMINKTLSCSIGIAKVVKNNSDSIFEAINNADKVLYDIKKTTKNAFKVWTNTTKK